MTVCLITGFVYLSNVHFHSFLYWECRASLNAFSKTAWAPNGFAKAIPLFERKWRTKTTYHKFVPSFFYPEKPIFSVLVAGPVTKRQKRSAPLALQTKSRNAIAFKLHIEVPNGSNVSLESIFEHRRTFIFPCILLHGKLVKFGVWA